MVYSFDNSAPAVRGLELGLGKIRHFQNLLIRILPYKDSNPHFVELREIFGTLPISAGKDSTFSYSNPLSVELHVIFGIVAMSNPHQISVN